MKLSKKLQSQVNFARWCQDYEVTPHDAAQLIDLAQRCANAGTNVCNYPDERYQTRLESERAKFRALAESLAFGVEFHGLYPSLTRGGRDIYLPD
jgi:hypothetical protein